MLKDNKDKLLDALELRLKGIYADAQDECDELIDRYMNGWDEWNGDNLVHHKGFYERYAEQRDMFDAGMWRDAHGNVVTDEKAWNKWVAAQEGRANYYFELRNGIAERLTKTNVIASDYINDRLPAAYSRASNEIAGLAKKAAMEQGVIGVRFDMTDESTLKAIMQDKDEALPYKPTKIDIPKDERWNSEKVQNVLYQGVLMGDDYSKLADRLQSVTNMNRSSAIRNARAAVTRARGAGRQDRMENLAEQGCITTKIWDDVHDSIPPERPEHWAASGQEVPYDEPFIVGGEELMYPGDPAGSGWNIYNCRCREKAGKFIFRSVLDDETRRKANIRVVDDKQESEHESNAVAYNRFGREIKFDERIAERSKEIITDLANEYDTRLESVKVAGSESNKSAGQVDVSMSTMYLSTKKSDVPIHEFAHTLAQTYADKVGISHDQEFWKEIKKVRRAYMKDVAEDSSRWISAYEHSKKDPDEFVAESFSFIKAREFGIDVESHYGNDDTYAKKVVDIIDKYFKKR